MRDLSRFQRDLHAANSPAEIQAVLLRDDIDCVLDSWQHVLERPPTDEPFMKGFRTGVALVVAAIDLALAERDEKAWVA